MNSIQQPHPTSTELRQFALGQLEPNRLAEVEKHVAECEQCCQSLRDVPDDTLLGRLRDGVTAIDVVDKSPEPSSMDSPTIPKELVEHPRYRIIRRLGRGGMGDVFQAEHRRMERLVALKVISNKLLKNSLAIERFQRETKAAAKLSHPNIVTAHDADEAGNLHFLVMEYVDGISLDQLIDRKGPISVAQACSFIRQAALGLHHAHESNMVHRDIKPHNLMLTKSGVVKILDFGLARIAAEAEEESVSSDDASGKADNLTVVGSVLGTPDYIAPEQARDSRNADGRADIYSLGCTLYYLLVGRPPFPDRTATEKLIAHREDEPKSVALHRGDIPSELTAVLDRMMAKSPDDRYQTGAEVAQVLTQFSRDTQGKPRGLMPTRKIAPDTETDEISKEWLRPSRLPIRSRRFWIGAAIVLLLLGTAIWLILDRLNRPDEVPPPPPAKKTGKVVMVASSRGLWYPDYAPIRKQLEDAGFNVQIASTTRETIEAEGPGDEASIGVPRTTKPKWLLSEVHPKDFDALVWVGKNGPMEFVDNEQYAKLAETITQKFLDDRKYVATVCRGTEVLGYNGFLKGKRIPKGKYYPEDAKTAWQYAEEVDEPYTMNGKLLIGRNPEDADAVGKHLAELLTDDSGS